MHLTDSIVAMDTEHDPFFGCGLSLRAAKYICSA